MKLFLPGLREVGVGSIVDVHPVGKWLGVSIPVEPWVFVLLWPHSFSVTSHDFQLNPRQRGFRTLANVLDRTILWRVADVIRTFGEDVPNEMCPFICLNLWLGLEVHRKDSIHMLLSSNRINCWKADNYFQDGTLGDGNVGVTVLDVFLGNKDEIMTHARSPVLDCWFPSGCSLKETLDYFGVVLDVQDPLAYLGGRVKAPYRFLICKPRLQEKDSQYIRKIEEEEIRKVSSLKCCERQCCQFFPRNKTLLVRQKFYLKSFEDHREYGLAVGRQLHTIDEIRKHKYITLEGVEVCGTA